MDWEQLSYIATVVAAMPVAASAFYFFINIYREHQSNLEAQRIERQENYSHLQAEFRKAQLWLADHPAVNKHDSPIRDPEVAEQQKIYYKVIISLLEESFILFHYPGDPEYERMWNSWDDYMNECLLWPNFRENLDELLEGEDAEFAAYMQTKKKAMPPQPARNDTSPLHAEITCSM